MFDAILTPELIAAILGLFAAILTFAITRASAAFTAATGTQIEAKHRTALHEALMSGAASAIEHGPREAVGTLKAHAIAHARESVPDAIRALVPGDTVLDTIAERYVLEAMARIGLPLEG